MASHPLLPNGGGGAITTITTNAWRDQLFQIYQNASRIGLWTADGEEVAFARRSCADLAGANCAVWASQGECENNPGYMNMECKKSCGKCGSSKSSSGGALPADDRPLYATLDHYPFVWPAEVGVRHRVEVEEFAPPIILHARSDSPRVFEAEGVASAADCEAIQRIAEPSLKTSVTFEQGKQQTGAARTSANTWLQLPPEDSTGDLARLRAVWLRLAAAVRMDPLSTENMQAISYGVDGHYYYHTDTGGSPVIAGRAITALIYLSDGFDGGETSFPLAFTNGETRNNVHRIREEFGGGCDPTAGLAVKPKAGNAVIFYNHKPNSAEKDFSTWHASCDVTSEGGKKYAANLWFHLHKAEEVMKKRLEAEDGDGE